MGNSLRRTVAGWALGLACLSSGSVMADPGDPAGWSLATDPRKRAFLKFAAEKDGPRLLLFACLRDADSFAVYSNGLDTREATDVELSLANGSTVYRVRGDIAPDGLSPQPTFSSDADADAAQLRKIKAALMPVLTGPGPIKLTVGSASRELPPTGLKAALDRFAAICFGR